MTRYEGWALGLSIVAVLASGFAVGVALQKDGGGGVATAIATGDSARPELDGQHLLNWMLSQEEAGDALRAHLRDERYPFVTGLITHLDAGLDSVAKKTGVSYEPLGCPTHCTGKEPPDPGCKIRPDCD